jgi:hypothetical protein
MSKASNSPATRQLRQRVLAIEIAGPVVVILIAWGSTNIRDEMSIANVALVMAAVTVGVAIVGWRGGLATSVAAALSLNYFHTEPVHTLRITATADVVAVALLASLGIAVSAATAMRVRSIARQTERASAALSRSDLATSLSVGQPVAQVWDEAVTASCAELALVDCRIEPAAATATVPVISRRHVGSDGSPTTLVLPATGASIPFSDERIQRRVVLTPRAGMGSLELDRRTVIAFVDQLELALSTPSGGGAQQP